MAAENVGTNLDAVVCEIDVHAPPARVFQALTDPKKLFDWWGKEPSVELSLFEMDARPGGRWRFRGKPAGRTEHDAGTEQLRRNNAQEFEAHGEVLEYDPPRLLVWSWIANWHERPLEPTVVRWELTTTKDGTRVRVTHSGLSRQGTAQKDYSGGWPGVLKLLRDFLP
jgi:uncharacterized protein YndB with AHSA1/START domain